MILMILVIMIIILVIIVNLLIIRCRGAVLLFCCQAHILQFYFSISLHFLIGEQLIFFLSFAKATKEAIYIYIYIYTHIYIYIYIYIYTRGRSPGDVAGPGAQSAY